MTLRLKFMGLLQGQIMKYLRIVSKSKLIFDSFFEISKVNITCKANHIKVQCAK